MPYNIFSILILNSFLVYEMIFFEKYNCSSVCICSGAVHVFSIVGAELPCTEKMVKFAL